MIVIKNEVIDTMLKHKRLSPWLIAAFFCLLFAIIILWVAEVEQSRVGPLYIFFAVSVFCCILFIALFFRNRKDY
jgi:hypothetical protein